MENKKASELVDEILILMDKIGNQMRGEGKGSNRRIATKALYTLNKVNSSFTNMRKDLKNAGM